MTGQGARREVSAELLPRDEYGPFEPTTMKFAFSSAAAATNRSTGLDTAHEHDSMSELGAQRAGDPRGLLRRLRVVDAAHN